jgi:hypothetical protein
MDARMSQPWTRSPNNFTHPDLLGWASDHRGELLAALLTLVRGWYTAGRPPAEVPTLGSFTAWAETLGSLLAYLRVPGFLGNLDALYAQVDEDGPQWEAFLMAWALVFDTRAITVKALVEELGKDESPLREAVPQELLDAIPGQDGAWGGFARRLGRALSKRDGVRYGARGLHVVRAGGAHNVACWRVQWAER